MIAEDALGDHPEAQRAAALANAASLVYSVLSEREAEGAPIDNETMRSLIGALLRRLDPK